MGHSPGLDFLHQNVFIYPSLIILTMIYNALLDVFDIYTNIQQDLLVSDTKEGIFVWVIW